MTLLKERDVPCAHVNTLEDLLTNPHLSEAGLFEEFDHPTEGRMMSVRSPFRVIGTNSSSDEGAPVLSGDASEILSEAGFTKDEIVRLMDQKIIGDTDSKRKAV